MFRGSDIPRLLAVAGCALLLTACGTDAVAPTATPPGPRADIIVRQVTETTDSVFAEVTVTPSGGYFNLGKNGVYFPPNVICDPERSTYGPTEWDKRCTVLKTPITITARMGKGVGIHNWIHFDQDLRFAPSKNSDNWVYLYIYDEQLARPRPSRREVLALESLYTIYWRPHDGAALVNEGVTDATLATHILWDHGYVYRRVKHFSGFQVGVGRVDAEGIDGITGGTDGAEY